MITFGNSKSQLHFSKTDGRLLQVSTDFAAAQLNSDLWHIAVRDRAYTIADMTSFSYAKTERTLQLHWGLDQLQVTVVITAEQNKLKWRIRTQGTEALHKIDFPVLRGMRFDGEDYLLLSWQNGCIVKNPVTDIFDKDFEIPFWMGRGKGAYINEYPAGLSYQFGAYYDPAAFGYYFSTEDPEAYIKTYTYQANKDGRGMDFILTNYPENIGTATGYCMPYDFVLELFQGDWRTAANRYRQWATQQKWCAKKLTDKALPDAVKTVDLWRINHTNYALGTRTQEYFDTTLQLRDALDCKLGLHWYGWNLGKHDVDYPDYISDEKKAQGWPVQLKQWNDRFTAEGVVKMPYINARLWEKTAPSWNHCNAQAYAVKDEHMQLCTEPWNGYQLTPLCPASTLWQDKCAEMAQEYVADPGFDGVYLDQVASFNAKLCFDPSHSHPVGGGNWWNNAYHSLLSGVRDVLGSDRVITTESCCETYIDVFDMFLTLDMNMQHTCFNELTHKLSYEPIPLFNMIYGDYALSYGSVCLFSHDPMRFEYNFIRNTLWGILPSIDGAEQSELSSDLGAKHMAVIQKGVDFFKEHRDLFLYGKIADVLSCDCDTVDVTFPVKGGEPCTLQVPAVYAVQWEAPSGEKPVILYNFADTSQTVTVAGKTVNARPKTFVKL